MHAVTKQFCLARVQQQGGVRVRLDRAGENHAAAADEQAADQFARPDVVQLRIADEIHAQRDKILRNGADEFARQHVLHLRAHPHRRRVHVAQLGHEVAVGKDIRLRQTLADIGQNAQSAPVTRHGQNHGPPIRQRRRNRLDQRFYLGIARGRARLHAVVAVQHGEIRADPFNRIAGMHARAVVIIAGEEQRAPVFCHPKPHASGTMAAASPRQRNAAGQRRFGIGHAQPLQNNRIVDAQRKLARRFRGQHHAPGETVGKQIGQRAGLVFVGVGEKQIARGTDLVGQQMGQFVPAVAALIAAVHDERRAFAFHKITVALLGTRLACQIKFHAAASSPKIRNV